MLADREGENTNLIKERDESHVGDPHKHKGTQTDQHLKHLQHRTAVIIILRDSSRQRKDLHSHEHQSEYLWSDNEILEEELLAVILQALMIKWLISQQVRAVSSSS